MFCSTSGIPPKDPLQNTYEQPEPHHGNFFQADETTELQDSEESETESESGMSDFFLRFIHLNLIQVQKSVELE